jgi:hypothetical protein
MLWRKRSVSPSVKAHWQALYAKNAADFANMFADGQTWTSWDSNTNPESSAEAQFLFACHILWGDDNWELARHYLELCLEIVDRTVRENRLPTFIDFPRNRGQMSRVKAYAQSLLGQPWDNELLLAASRDYEEHCRKNYPAAADWHSQVQYYYLNAVHLALLGDDIERASTVLETPSHPLKYQQEHVKILKGLMRLIRGELSQEERATFTTAYEDYFDRLRDPRIKQPGNSFREVTCPLELALLREKYIQHPGETVNWQRVIDDYSR